MTSEVKVALKLFIELLSKLNLTYEMVTLTSGVVIIDVFYYDTLYEFQFHDKVMGYSKIDENTAFNPSLEVQFISTVKFIKDAELLFNSKVKW